MSGKDASYQRALVFLIACYLVFVQDVSTSCAYGRLQYKGVAHKLLWATLCEKGARAGYCRAFWVGWYRACF